MKKKRRESKSSGVSYAETPSRSHRASYSEAGPPDDALARKRRRQLIAPDSAESGASLAIPESRRPEIVPHIQGRTGSAVGRACSIVLGNGLQSAQRHAAVACHAGRREDEASLQQSPRATP